MYFKAQIADMEKAVSTVIRAVPGRSPIPILSGIYLEASKDKDVWMSGTDLDLSIGISVSAEVEDDGRTVIPAKLLASILKHANGATLEVNVSDRVAQLRCGSAEWEINTMNPDEFPEFPTMEKQHQISVPGDKLATMINQTYFATDKNPTRPFITGVLLDVKGQVSLVATDTYRLAVSSTNLVCDAASPVIIPVNALRAVAGSIPEEGAMVDISINEKSIAFDVRLEDLPYYGVSIISRIIPGTFPDYRMVIPEATGTVIEADKQELIEAIERVIVVARGEEYVPLTWIYDSGANILTLSTHGGETGKGEDIVSCDVLNSAGDWQATTRASYVLEGLKTMLGRISIAHCGESKPLMFRDMTWDYTYCVMPMGR